MIRTSSVPIRLISVIGAAIIATLVVVPTMVRAQHRLPHHDLGHHDPVPQRLRYNWNGETPGKVKPALPDTRQVISPLPAPRAFAALTGRSARSRVTDERVPIFALDRSPFLFRGPPPTLVS
jgi:hypothetical protein